MLGNQYLFASVLLVAAGSRSPLPPAEPPPDVVADMKGVMYIGDRLSTAGAVDFQTMVQLFDPVLDITPSAVDRLIQMPRRLLEVGDHEVQRKIIEQLVDRRAAQRTVRWIA